MKRTYLIQILIVVIGAVVFLPGLGDVHLFDWDEINFAESAREMIVSGDYLTVQINFEPFWEKPPLFIWMQVFSMKIFGINEFAARFPNAICGIVTLLVLFNIGRKLKDENFGLLWVLLYACSFLPFFYFKSGIIDPWFNLFIFLGIYYFILYTSPENGKNRLFQSILSGGFLGLAVLTKGPVGFLIFALSFLVYLVLNKFKFSFKWRHVFAFLAVFVFVGGFWFILQIINGNFTVIQDFIRYQIRLFETQDAGHGGFLLYHFVILFIGVFPASLLMLPAFRIHILRNEYNRNMAHFFRWMMIVFWVVLILFTIVRTKIIHYSSFCYFPMTFFAAWYLEKLLIANRKIPVFVRTLIAVIGTIFGIAVIGITFFDRFKEKLLPYIEDEFARGTLQATASWMGFEWIIGVVLIVAIVFFLVFSAKNETQISSLTLMLFSLWFILSTMLFIVPQVERYSQLSAIEFYESKRGENCYIYPTSKSYAHYFYSFRLPENKNDDENFLQFGNIDKPCYFVLKNQSWRVQEFEEKTPDARKMYEKNGFVFYFRNPKRTEWLFYK